MSTEKVLKNLRILLIQIRKDPDMLPIERSGFVGLSDLDDRQFTTLDVFRQPDFGPEIMDGYDAIFTGGLSDDPNDSVDFPLDTFPFINNLKNLLCQAAIRKKPALLSCGGFTIASQALGGKVAIDHDRKELGVYSIYLTSAGKKDPLFAGFPDAFEAVSGHIKSTVETPPGCILLASSKRCPVHAFRVKDAPFYAFQFHPEIRCEALRERVERYKTKYFDSEEEYLQFIALMHDTSIANSIVRRFVELVAQNLNYC